jgi:cytochrome P450
VASAYSLSSILELEAAVDSCTEVFISKLRSFAYQKTPVDLGMWLQYYAFDVVGEITFAQKLGFLEKGRDIDGMMEAIQGILVYASVCGQVPEMHSLLLGNPLIQLFMPSMESWNQVLQFTLKAVNSRSTIQEGDELGKVEDGKDMLSRWMKTHTSDPQKLSERDVIVHLSTNVFAGSDTTAIALRAVFYLLMRNPEVAAKLQLEIDNAVSDQKLSDPISYHESVTHLPYLGAVLKEAMRLHPSVGMILEREVPPGGVTISGKYFPGGTIVGINAWVLHRNKEVFPDPDSFIPERWLESSPEVLKKMDKSNFTFGAGSRTCIGKNISLVEMYKIIPQLLREFEFRLHSPEKDWTIRNAWFVQQEGLLCDLVQRKVPGPRAGVHE